MSLAVDPNAVFDYIDPEDLALDPEDPFRTVWGCKPLTLAGQEAVQNAAASIDGEEVNVKSGTVSLETLRRGLVSVTNFRDPNKPCELCEGKKWSEMPEGTDRCRTCDGAGVLCVEFDINPLNKQPSNRFLSRIPSGLRQRLSGAIGRDSNLSEKQTGES